MSNWYKCIICNDDVHEKNFKILKNGARSANCNKCFNIRRVKRIPPIGFQNYPAIQNIDSGAIYVDVTLATENCLIHDADGYNKFGEFVNYKGMKGAWHTFHEEPEYPLKQEIEFIVVT